MEPSVRKAHDSDRWPPKDGPQPVGSLPKNSPRDVSARRLFEGYAFSSRDQTRHLGKLKARALMHTQETRLTHFPFFFPSDPSLKGWNLFVDGTQQPNFVFRIWSNRRCFQEQQQQCRAVQACDLSWKHRLRNAAIWYGYVLVPFFFFTKHVTNTHALLSNKQTFLGNQLNYCAEKRWLYVWASFPFILPEHATNMHALILWHTQGEYYTMLAHDSPSTQQYRTDHRSIFMYNCKLSSPFIPHHPQTLTHTYQLKQQQAM